MGKAVPVPTPGKKKTAGAVLGFLLCAALVAHALGGAHIHMASGGSQNTPKHARAHAAPKYGDVPGDPCLPGTPNKTIAGQWDSKIGTLRMNCSGWRHTLRRHRPKGATADEIRKCIGNTITNGILQHFPEGMDGHLPSWIFTWRWGNPLQWTRVIVAHDSPVLTSAYVNNDKAAAASPEGGGSWRDCAAARAP